MCVALDRHQEDLIYSKMYIPECMERCVLNECMNE
jgi:hypothetical protein